MSAVWNGLWAHEEDAAKEAYKRKVGFREVEKCCETCKWYFGGLEGFGNCTHQDQNEWLLKFRDEGAGEWVGIDCYAYHVCNLWEKKGADA